MEWWYWSEEPLTVEIMAVRLGGGGEGGVCVLVRWEDRGGWGWPPQ